MIAPARAAYWVTLLLCGAGPGCNTRSVVGDPATPPTAGPERRAASPAASPAPAPSPATADAPAAPRREAAPGERAAAGATGVVSPELMEEVRRAAIAAEGRGSTICEQGYHASVASAEVLRRALPDRVAPTPSMERFIAACEVLPDASKRCMVMSYAMEHEAECDAARDALDHATQERVQALLLGRSTAPP